MARWDMRQRLVALVMIFTFALGMLAMLHGAPVSGTPVRYSADLMALVITAAMLCMILLGATLLPKWFGVDPLLMTLTNFLCALGIFVQYSINPNSGLFHALLYAAGSGLMIFTAWLIRRFATFRKAWPIIAVIAAGLLIAPLFNTVNNAHAHIPIWRDSKGLIVMTLQPSEAVKVILVIMLADMLSGHSWWPDAPWAAGFSLMCVGLLIAEKDMGTCMLYALTVLFMFYAASGSFAVLLGGGAVGMGAAQVIYQYTDNVKRRVAQWLNPFMREQLDNGTVGLLGHQIAESLMALAAGGVHGLGYGIRDTFRYVPEYSNDFVFTVVCSQFGVVFALAVMGAYVVMIFRGMRIAERSRRRFHSLMAIGASALLGIQAFVIIGGVINMFPLTGVTMPFVSQGGSSMLSCMALMGILHGVSACADKDEQEARRLTEQPTAARPAPRAGTRSTGVTL
ncbi:cell division protein FtsW [Clostridia bacterium]|nr:cell division protein FtsW [Clostridia bacterium]